MSESQMIKKSTTDIIAWSIVGILGCVLVLWIVIPNFVKSRATSAANPCINNLRQIDAAACQFALETGKTNGDRIHFPTDLMPYIKLNSAGSIPPCPSGGTYHIEQVGETPTCSLGTTVVPAHSLR